MAISLYDVSVTNYLQTLQAVAGFLDKGLAHLKAEGKDPEQFVETRLFPDMLDFRFQIASVTQHSLGAIEAAKAGVFTPPVPKGETYAGLQQRVADARAGLQALSREEVEALEGKEMVFALGERRLPFTVENFILSFSLPNFHFHATTAYDILRANGVPLGKRDYMGPLRMKT
ncbi:DUF1993 domain-containing protein [Phenylobacterium sp.]|jgi:hypothetical protein|uniref:DUF1993 domain-containing protein n=1 Tax=Phenylobacterium sp. TaxID=1871053 RepID=UPI002E36C94E|nr:DUF1993 domain-containing protein [Phenylobacterium sp.]HEX2559406.1 DUF1993 domain-containing protein [Phenylobacterium sp.]